MMRNLRLSKKILYCLIVFSIVFSFLSKRVIAQTTQTFTTNGTFTIPAGVTSVTIKVWGGGGGGGYSDTGNGNASAAGGGGGGGGYRTGSFSVIGGQTISIAVGVGGAGAVADAQAGLVGGTSTATYSGVSIVANGGRGGGAGIDKNNGGVGGVGGTGSGGTSGYSGAAGVTGGKSTGGAGGGGAGDANNASGITGGANSGGNGGAGGNSANSGTSGSTMGGGGGGTGDNAATPDVGGSGARGQIVISYTCSTYSLTGTSATNACTLSGTSIVTLTSSAAGLPVGTYSVTYSRSNPAVSGIIANMTVSTAGAGTFTATGLTTAGTSTITITNLQSSYCSNIISTNSTVAIVVKAVSSQPSAINGTTSLCSGNTGIAYSVTNVANITYTWSYSGTNATIASGQGTNSITVNYATNATSGTWTVTPSNACGNGTAQTLVVTVNAIPATPTISGSPTTFCSGGSVTLTSSAGTSYLWSNGATTQAINVTTSGSYSVKITNGGCQSASSASTTVTVNTLPSAVTVTGAGTFCGNTTITASNGSDGTIYFQGTTSGGTSTATASSSQIVSSSGTYYFRAQSASGCWGTEGSAVVIINTVPNAPTATAILQPNCSVSTGKITVTAPTGSGMTYSINGSDYTNSTGIFTSVASGSYNVTAKSSGGCISSGTSVTINAQPSTPSAPNVGSIIQPTCSSATGSVILTGLPATGNWTLTRTPGGTSTTGTGSSTTITGLSAGTYTYTVSNSNNNGSCPGAGNGLYAEYFTNMTLTGTPALTRTDATVDFNWITGNPGSPITDNYYSVRWTGKVQPCFTENYTFTTRSDDGVRLWVDGTLIINDWNVYAAKDNTGTINLTSGQKYDIVLEYYENEGEAVAQLSWQSSSLTKQIIPQAQLYSVSTGCTSSASADVVINTQPTNPAGVTASGAGTFCASTTISASNGSDGTIYFQGTSSGGTSTATASSSQVVSSSGTYYFRAKSATGCWGAEGSVSVIINTPPTASIGNNNGLALSCTIPNTTLTASGGGTYLWSTGATTAAITVGTAGTFTVTVTGSNGCTATTSVTTTLNNTPPTAASITSATSVLNCTTTSIALTAAATDNSGSNNLTYTWTGGGSGTTTNVTTPGTYTVTITDPDNGCTVTTSKVITQNIAAPTVNITGTTSICINGTTQLSPSSGGIWVSNNPTIASVNNSGLVTGIAAGTASFTFTSSNNGCSATTTSITVRPLTGIPTFTLGSTSICQNADDETYTATAANSASIEYSVMPITAGTINTNTGVMNWDSSFSGTATITATAIGSCGTTNADRIVTVNPLPATGPIVPD